jgi:hypothetical protein
MNALISEHIARHTVHLGLCRQPGPFLFPLRRGRAAHCAT